jgi:hypothetical protein
MVLNLRVLKYIKIHNLKYKKRSSDTWHVEYSWLSLEKKPIQGVSENGLLIF